MSEDNIYVLGATGNIGSHLVKGLIAAGVRTTIFVRNEDKAKTMFDKEFSTGHLHIVQGDYQNVEAYENSISGHTRLFLLVAELEKMPQIKGPWAKIAYDRGVKQIVDISSNSCQNYMVGYISKQHSLGEDALLSVVGNNSLVILRPGYYTSNHLHFDVRGIKNHSKIIGTSPPEFHLPCIDVRDIADVALNVFLDPIEKHGICIYPLCPEPVSQTERALIFSRVLGREISYVQESMETVYNRYISMKFSHLFAYDIVSIGMNDFKVPTSQISVLLKKPFRRLEQWVEENKEHFL